MIAGSSKGHRDKRKRTERDGVVLDREGWER